MWERVLLFERRVPSGGVGWKGEAHFAAFRESATAGAVIVKMADCLRNGGEWWGAEEHPTRAFLLVFAGKRRFPLSRE
jgi:hypothetical protein